VTGGQVIGTIMQRQGVSVSELAARLQVSDGQIVAWMRGDPPLSVVDSVARACATELAVVLADLKPENRQEA
jgi:transcriptional regulator with XRE-family HTH domain